MKKFLLSYSIFLGLALQALSIQAYQYCNESGTTSITQQSLKIDNTEAVRFIKNFYANCVFKTTNYIPTLKKHCTSKLLKELKDDYKYDGEGYAIWNFRTGAQDGPSDISKVTAVTALGKGLYKVNFIDMGIKGNRTLKIVNVNGTLKFDAIK